MGKGANAKQEVSEYSMSIHLGGCHGPVDAITGLFVGEKEAWSGEVTGETGIYVNAPNLFGGPKSGGGVGGVMYYLPGGPYQIMPNDLAERLGLTSNTCPAYRGVASVFFIGTDGIPYGSLDTSGGSPSGGGSSGGGGYGTGGDGTPRCVWAEAYIEDGRQAKDIEVGDWLLVLDYQTMSSTTYAQVRGVSRAQERCVTIITDSGVRKTVSCSTPLTMPDKTLLNVMDWNASTVPVQDEQGFRWEEISTLELAGVREVIMLDLGGATFAAGDMPGRMVFTHNKDDSGYYG